MYNTDELAELVERYAYNPAILVSELEFFIDTACDRAKDEGYNEGYGDGFDAAGE